MVPVVVVGGMSLCRAPAHSHPPLPQPRTPGLGAPWLSGARRGSGTDPRTWCLSPQVRGPGPCQHEGQELGRGPNCQCLCRCCFPAESSGLSWLPAAEGGSCAGAAAASGRPWQAGVLPSGPSCARGTSPGGFVSGRAPVPRGWEVGCSL